jgi:predicted nuclease with TOPRIM domain
VIYDDIRDFAEATKHAAETISKKLVRLQNRVERLLGRPVDLDKRWAEVERQLPHPDDGE